MSKKTITEALTSKKAATAAKLFREEMEERLDEVEVPANYWNAGMAKMNPIQVSQKQPAEPGQFKATLTKSPKRLADRDGSLEGAPEAVRQATCDVATQRGPKTIELTGDWHADIPDHAFDSKLDSETEYYPLFSQFKAMGAYPSGPARAWEETEINESEDFDRSYQKHPVFQKNFTNKDYTVHRSSEGKVIGFTHKFTNNDTDHEMRVVHQPAGHYTAEVSSAAHHNKRNGHGHGKTSHEAVDMAHKEYKENFKMPEYVKEGIDFLAEGIDESYKTHPFFQKHFEGSKEEEGEHYSTGRCYNTSTPDGSVHNFSIMQPDHTDNHHVIVSSRKHGIDKIGQGKDRDAHRAIDKALKQYHNAFQGGAGPHHLEEQDGLKELRLDEISKKTLGSYLAKAVTDKERTAVAMGNISGNRDKAEVNRKWKKRQKGIETAIKKLSEDSASLMATATKDEKKAAEEDKKKPAGFKKFHDKHEKEVKGKMKELGEEALEEGLFDPSKRPLLDLWDEHARRSAAHGSGSRTEILKRIEDHVAKKHGQEGLKKMRLHSDLSNALNRSLSPDKGHLQALLGNMRAKCSMEA